ncbi:MAG: 30S ribosomal protein S18 [bacterium]
MKSKDYKRICRFCIRKIDNIDYKDVDILKRYITEKSKIAPRRMTKCCAQHQRKLTTAIKRARNIALLPFAT